MRPVAIAMLVSACANGTVVGSRQIDASVEDAVILDDAAVSDAGADMLLDASWAPIDPFVVSECPLVAWQDLAARFSPGGTLVAIPGTFSVTTRHRESCNQVTGCTPWIDGGGQIVAPANPPVPALGPFVPPTTGTHIELRLENPRFRLDLYATGPSGETLHFDCNAYGPNYGSTNACAMLADPTRAFYVQWHSGQDGLGQPTWIGQLCADGRYHFVTELPPYVILATNYVQLAIYGHI